MELESIVMARLFMDIDTNDERWHPLPGAPHRNSVKGCSQEGHFDKDRVAGHLRQAKGLSRSFSMK